MRRPLCTVLLLFLCCYLTVCWGLSECGGGGSGRTEAAAAFVSEESAQPPSDAAAASEESPQPPSDAAAASEENVQLSSGTAAVSEESAQPSSGAAAVPEENTLPPSADSGWEVWAGETVLLTGIASELYEPVGGAQTKKSFTVKQAEICLESGERLSESDSGIRSLFQGIPPKSNSVLCYLENGENLPPVGSVVQVRGVLTPFSEARNPGAFDLAGYYETRGYSCSVRKAVVERQGESFDRAGNFLYELRCFWESLFYALLGEEDGAVAAAMVLGIKKGMDGDLKELYRDAGIAHLLAISGLHVTLFGAAVLKALRGLGLPQWAAAGAAALMVCLYGRIAGMSVSMLRAMILFFLMLAAGLFKRTSDPLTGLAIAACAILVPRPRCLFDSAFLLSFLAVTGAVTVVPVLRERGLTERREKRDAGKRAADFLFQGIASSLGITLATLPVLLLFNYKWNPWSILANLAAVPLMGILLPWLLCLAGGGLLARVLPEAMIVLKVLALPAKGIFFLYRLVCRIVLLLPGSSLHTGAPRLWQVLLYCAGLLALLLAGRKLRPLLRLPCAIFLTAVFLIRLPGQTEITMLDVGQGECVCLETGAHDFYLIDAGSSSDKNSAQYQIIPFLEYSGARRIEGIFITHWDEDHVNALEGILEWAKKERVAIGRLILPDTALTDEGLEKLLTLAERFGIFVERIGAGAAMRDGALTITCLHPFEGQQPGDRNAVSSVLKLEIGGFSALFTGDLEKEGEEWLVRTYGEETLGACLLDAGHHGAANATGEEFLRAVSPEAVLISCGKNNAYGHPAKETLERIRAQDAACFITAECGAVTVRVGKKSFEVTAFCGGP